MDMGELAAGMTQALRCKCLLGWVVVDHYQLVNQGFVGSFCHLRNQAKVAVGVALDGT